MVEITPYPVPEEEDRVNTSERLRQRTIEYMKYLATVALMELPGSVIPPALYGRFYNGCPTVAEKTPPVSRRGESIKTVGDAYLRRPTGRASVG